jgi:hypothetical protein
MLLLRRQEFWNYFNIFPRPGAKEEGGHKKAQVLCLLWPHSPSRVRMVEFKPMFDPQPLHYRPLESRANLFAD